MCTLWTLLLWGAIQSSQDAVAAIAADTDQAPAAVAYLKGRGRPGLRALNEAAKRATGPEKVRLLSAMGDLGVKGAEWSLRQAFKDGTADAQLGSVQGLLKLPDSVGIRAVLVEAARSTDPEVQEAAAQGLSRRLAVEAIREELSRMLLEPDLPQRRTAILTAALAEDGALTAEALEVALSDGRTDVQIEALNLIAAQRDAAYLPAVRDRLRHPDPEVSRRALEIVLDMEGSRAMPQLSSLVADPSLPDPARIRMVDALRQADAAGFDALVQGLATLPDGPEFIAARLGQVSVPDPEQVRWVRTLASPRPRVQEVAAAALRALRPEVDSKVVAELAAREPQTRARALAFLMANKDPALTRALEQARRSERPAERAGAVVALIRMAEAPSDWDSLLNALDDEDAAVRVAAVRSFSALGVPSVDRSLEAKMATMDPAMQVALLEGGQGRREPTRWWAWATDLLDAEDPDVRRAAVRALTPAPNRQSLGALENYLRSAPAAEKPFAVQAIAASQVVGSGELLIELVTDPDPEVRKAALAYTETM